ncbi:MAG: hypothetical protein QFX35_03475 [Candidatus Verstraetearchaeota archaeon]|nr:hypothetical protein [Candidatus Verstraetearchaeota archaeon]
MSSERPSFIIKEPELQILVNLFEEVEIRYPVTHLPLFDCRWGGKDYRIKSRFDRGSFTIADEDAYLEGPSYSDVIECLMSSGVLGFTNVEEFRKRLEAYRNHRKVFFALDTNMIYRRFVSNTGLIDPNECLIVSTVRDEVTSVHNFKYSQDWVQQMKRAAPFERGLLEELVNRRMKKSRKASRFANRELLALAGATNVDADERFTGEEGQGDRIIARTVSRFVRERGVQTVMLTADCSMVDICEAEGVEYFLFEMPKEVPPELGCNDSRLIRLVSDLASVLALVKLNSVILYGEFRAKRDKDDLKAVFLDRLLGDEFKVDLETCRRLLSLGMSR